MLCAHAAQPHKAGKCWTGHMREHLETLARRASAEQACLGGQGLAPYWPHAAKCLGHEPTRQARLVTSSCVPASQFCTMYHQQDECGLAGSSQQASRAGHWAQKHRPAAREALVVHKDKVNAVDAWLHAQLQEGGSSSSSSSSSHCLLITGDPAGCWLGGAGTWLASASQGRLVKVRGDTPNLFTSIEYRNEGCVVHITMMTPSLVGVWSETLHTLLPGLRLLV